MTQEKLNEILRRHKAWLNREDGGEHADLHGAILHDVDFRGADLHDVDFRRADLRYADLRRSDLRGADIDFASWPLWCGSLKAYVDDRIAIQLLYHTLSVVQNSPYVSEDVKRTSRGRF